MIDHQPEAEAEDSSVDGLRDDIRELGRRQTADAKVLHGRIGGMERKHDELATKVNELQVESAKQTHQLEFLVQAEQKREQKRELEERVELETRAATGVELVRQGGDRRSFWYKVIGAIVSAAAGALGANAAGGF